MGRRLTYKSVKESFEKEGYILLTTEYINAQQKLEYICLKDHKHIITWNNWQQGKRCFYCGIEKIANKSRLDIKLIKSKFERQGYKLLTKKYENAHQKLSYICPKGHKHDITWDHFRDGHRCPYCAKNIKLTIEFIRSEFAKEDYRLLTSEYINNNQKLEYICPNGHRHSISWANWTQGRRCIYCVNKISRGEVEVKNFVESLGVKVLPNDRNQIFNPKTGYPFELDIFMPTLNKAIEYNGEYWHRDKERDLFKQHLCESKNINLLTIWDREWLNENKKCRSEIEEFILRHNNWREVSDEI